MRVSVCVGNYAKTPYCLPGVGVKIFCMEELCRCLKENAFLLDASLLREELSDWIGEECGLRELSEALRSLIRKQSSLSAFAVSILRYVGFYDEETVRETEEMLKQSAGLSGIEKQKAGVDYLVRKKKYKAAIAGYDELLRKWQEQESRGKIMPAADCLAAIRHNKGVACTGLMLYESAAECFLAAWELTGGDEYFTDYLAAERMHLSEEEYVALASGYRDKYRQTMELEKKMERALREWEQQPDYLRLYNRREQYGSGDRQRFYEDNERLTQALKDSYRSDIQK